MEGSILSKRDNNANNNKREIRMAKVRSNLVNDNGISITFHNFTNIKIYMKQ